MALGYGILVSLAAVAVDDMSRAVYRGYRNLLILLLSAIVENIGFRQLHAWWRIRGVVSGVMGSDSGWGTMTRTGLGAGPAAAKTENP